MNPETGGVNAQGDPNMNDVSTPTIYRRCMR